MDVSLTLWVLTIVGLCALIAADFFIGRKPHDVSVKEAGIWTVVWIVLAALFGLGLLIVTPATAQQPLNVPMVEYVPANSHPPLPPGLQLACIKDAGSGAPTSDTCPVVKYQGVVTWAFSFADNRSSFAIVSFDERGNLLRNVEKPGARYVFDAMTSLPNQTVTFVGQAANFVTVPWSERGQGTATK